MLESETVEDRPWQRQRLRVPRENGSLFVVPALQEAVDLARLNQSRLGEAAIDLQGRTLEQMRRWARQEAVKSARLYTSELINEPLDEPAFDLLFVSGHQPSLFHPGVWIKNFGIDELSRRGNGQGLNLVVDNDTLSTSSVRIPCRRNGKPVVEQIPFDADRLTLPWEEAEVQDQSIFESFGTRVRDALSEWGVVPLAGELWQDVIAHSRRSHRLADCFTAARSRLERRWGAANLELPLSRLCSLDSFLWFAGHLLAQLPRFREIHNDVLQQFRRVNKIRSRTHPVPELLQSESRLEAPFWVWRAGDHQRKRVFARQMGREVWLSDESDVFAKMPLTPDGDACCAVEVLRELPAQGIRMRTRALTTTLFARLCLGDLFVHGIGGAKYDEMTDHIIARFFRIPPPGFLTMSATVHLPLDEPFPVQPEDESQLRTLLRDFHFNSDRHLSDDADSEIDRLITAKRALVGEQQALPTGLNRRQRRARRWINHERFQKFRALSERLEQFTGEQRLRIEQDLQTVRDQRAANALLQSREYSFSLYPEEKLRPLMTGLGQQC